MRRPVGIVRYAVFGACAVYSVLLYLSGAHLDTWYKYLITLLPAVAAAVLLVWDSWIWRIPIFLRMAHRPRIDGLWKVSLLPTAESHIPVGGNRGPIPGFLVVRQSYWVIYIRQFTEESASKSRAFFWERHDGADLEGLTFIYENVPLQQHQRRSMRHLGACSFDIGNRQPTEMTGVYFTDRYTKGDMHLILIDRSKGYGSYAEVLAHLSTTN